MHDFVIQNTENMENSPNLTLLFDVYKDSRAD